MAAKTTSQPFNPKDYSHPGLPEERVQEIKNSFDLFDLTGSGTITPKELNEAFISIGFMASNSTVYQIFSSLDTNCSGAIDFEEFLGLMTSIGQVLSLIHI